MFTYEPVDQSGVLVVIRDVDAQEVHVDGVFLPHAVQQTGHLDAVVDGDCDVRVLHDGNPHPETHENNLRQTYPDVGSDAAVFKTVQVTHPG